MKDANIDDVDEFNDYLNKIGNKILLELSINRGVGDAWFRTKVTTNVKDKTGYVNSTYPLAKYLVNENRKVEKPSWTKEDIDSETQKANERILKFIFSE